MRLIKSIYVKDFSSLENGTNYTSLDNCEDNGDAMTPSIKEDSDRYLKERNERLYWVDCLRIFASMLVVFISSTGFDLNHTEFKSYNWNVLLIYNSLPRASVPLFIMISGIFFLDVVKPLPIKKIYTKYLFRIFRCYLFWSLYYTLFDKFIINYNQKNYKFSYSMIQETIVNSINDNGHLWYLNYIMGMYIVTPLFRGAAYNENETKYIFWVFAIISSIIPTISDFFETFLSIELSMVTDFLESLRMYCTGGFTFYYFLGYLITYGDYDEIKYKFISYCAGIIGIVITIAIRIFSNIYLDYESNVFSEFNSINIAMVAIGIFVFFKCTVREWLRNFSEDSRIKKFILTLSNCSFGIYLIHVTISHLLYRFAKFNPQSFNPIFCAPLFSAAVYVISFIIIFILRKIIPFKYIC